MPYILSAQVAINDKDYLKAAQVLKALNTRYPAQNDMIYYYAYALYCAGDNKTALDKWTQYAEAAKKVMSSQNDLDRLLAVPYYFIGQCHLRSGDKAKAVEYFKMILAGKDDSKYAYLAKVQLDNLGK
jgi:tetratricopeptide (TPR) repeat protein